MSALDPVTLAVLKGRLEQIVDEMDATLYRSAFSTTIAEARDACHGIYDPVSGDTLVQGSNGLPIFVGAMAFCVRAIIDKVAREGGLAEGDTYIFNDPYLGGTHLNDFRLIRPIFRDGQLFCWIASAGHWLDIGGNVAGSYNPKATDMHQEGVRIPPVKLASARVMNPDILAILAANTRVPMSNWGDMNAQLNALDLGEARLNALLDDYTDSTVSSAFTAYSDRAEALMRQALSSLPEGTYSFEDVLDNDGIIDAPLTVALDATIKNGTLELDFTRSSDAAKGPISISEPTTIAACYVALKHIFTDVPANAGCMRPVSFKVRKGSILAAEAPHPMAGYTETILRLIGVVLGMIAKADPARATAAPFGTINALSLTGTREDGKPWVMFSFFGGGLGGNPESDGLHHANNPISTATIPPVEILEAAYPVMFTQWALREDSGGAGAHRGGVGAIYEIETLTDAQGSILGERARAAPFGVEGGGAAALNRVSWMGDKGWELPEMASKATGVPLPKGRRIRLESPGGGGWGDPKIRDPEAVARDVRLGYVSRATAESLYGVALDASGACDLGKTEQLRKGDL